MIIITFNLIPSIARGDLKPKIKISEQDCLKVIMLFVGMNVGAFLSKEHISEYAGFKDTGLLSFSNNKNRN